MIRDEECAGSSLLRTEVSCNNLGRSISLRFCSTGGFSRYPESMVVGMLLVDDKQHASVSRTRTATVEDE